MAIREVYAAIEATEGTAAASGYVVLRTNSPSFEGNSPRDKLEETTGTTIRFHRSRRGRKWQDFTIRMYDYYDMVVYMLAAAFGAPVVAGVSGATGAFDHTFKPGGATQKSLTIKWKRQVRGGYEWRQMVGARVKTVKRTMDNEGTPMLEFTGSGKYATVISAPTPVSDTTAAYTHPDLASQTLTLGGSAWSAPKGMEIEIDTGLEPDWSLNGSQDLARMRLGTTVATVAIPEAFYDAYAGSLHEARDSATGLLGQIIYTSTDPSTTIGTGTPVPPRTVWTFPKPSVDDAGFPDVDHDADESGEIELAYDSTLASLASIVYRNELASSIYTGS